MAQKLLVYSRYFHVQRDLELFSKEREIEVVFYANSKLGSVLGGSRYKSLYSLVQKESERLDRGAASERVRQGELDRSDVREVVKRCRLLRQLAEAEALQRLTVYWNVWSRVLEQQQPNVVFAQAVDNYILDLLRRACKRTVTRFVGVSASYFPGYSYLTDGSVPILDREVSREEACEVYNVIGEASFRREYSQTTVNSQWSQLRQMVKGWGRVLAFKVARKLMAEPYHYHWEWGSVASEVPSLQDYSYTTRAGWVGSIEGLSRVLKRRMAAMYVPLSVTPEMANDYWSREAVFCDYEWSIMQICRALSGEYCIVVKEHPHMLGMRSRCFYRQLEDLQNVVVVDPSIRNGMILQLPKIAYMVTGAGSSGLEAGIRGVPVISYAKDVYWLKAVDAIIAGFADLTSKRRFQDLVRRADESSAPKDPRRIVRQCLRHHYPDRVHNGELSESVRQFIGRIA